MNKKIVEKYFANQTTPGETRKVLEWFETPEGKKYLLEKMESDSVLLDNRELRNRVRDFDSEKLFSSISNELFAQRKRGAVRRRDWLGYVVKAAAIVLVLFSASWITLSLNNYQAEQIVEAEPIHIQTGDEQHREVTLNDGSLIRLNSNSEIIVSESFMKGSREVTLYGEAYFDIEHNPEQPFIIHTNESSVEVLGTEFNVRSHKDENNVQVAVVEGRVSFKDIENNSERHSVVLNKGQYAYMDINEHSILVDDLAVENYLAWKSGSFVFEESSLNQVCKQLNRIYNIECSFEIEELKDVQLTANFSNESLEKTLTVIALSLNLDYNLTSNRVQWSNQTGGNAK